MVTLVDLFSAVEPVCGGEGPVVSFRSLFGGGIVGYVLVLEIEGPMELGMAVWGLLSALSGKVAGW